MNIKTVIDERYAQGDEKLAELSSDQLFELRDLLKSIDSASERQLVAECFGHLFNRNILSDQQREQAIICSLIAQRCTDQLTWHFSAGLRAGLSLNDLVGTIALTIPFCGWPSAINGFKAFADWAKQKNHQLEAGPVFDTSAPLSDDGQFSRIGYDACASIYPDPNGLMAAVESFHPDLPEFLVKGIFGYTYGRNDISPQNRQLCAIAILTTLQRLPQLKSHIEGAFQVECTQEQMAEVLILMSAYTGWPAALNGFAVFNEVRASKEN